MREKVLFVITKSNFGGAQRYVYDLATRLPKEEYDAVVVCGNAPDGSPGPLIKQLEGAQVRVITLPYLTRNIGFTDVLAFVELLDVIKAEHPDVIHLNSSKVGILGTIAGRIARVPNIIFTAHGWAFGEKRFFVSRLIILLVSWLTVILSHRTICVSSYDRSLMASAPWVKKKLVIIRNGIESFALKNRDDARGELFSAEEQVAHADDAWVLTNSELTENKNLILGIDAIEAYNAASTKKIYWTMIGDGEKRQQLENLVLEKGLATHIKFLGFVPNAREYYRAFDAFFLPSLKEGLPYVLLEAGIAELSVAASNAGGIPEIIGEGFGGVLANPHDTQALTESLKSALEHPEWGRVLKEKVLKEYSLDLMLRETFSLYQQER